MATVSSIATIGREAGAGAAGHKVLPRAAIVSAALIAGAAVLPSSLASWADVDHPLIASKIAPWNAPAAADSAAAISTNPQSEQVRALVTKALSRDLTQIEAIELRALDFSLSGKTAKGRRLFQLSDQLSRRSLPTRLWLIQDAVDHGNVAAALRNFDLALRTTTDAQPILFPVLARACEDPTLTKPLARMLDRSSEWRLPFFEWSLENDRDLRPLANVVAHMGDRQFIKTNAVDQHVIERLVTDGHFDEARLLNRRFGLPTSGIADPRFGNSSARYPFGWEFVNDGSLSAERVAIGSSSALIYSAAPAKSGQVAAQLLGLRPGRYRLTTATFKPATGAAPYWAIGCAEAGGGELARLDQPNSAGGRAATMFSVPGGCASQWLTLSLRPAPDSGTQSGTIAWVWVSPASDEPRDHILPKQP